MGKDRNRTSDHIPPPRRHKSIWRGPAPSALTAVFALAGITQAAPVSWVLDADGSWNTAANWSSSPALPGATDDVTINRPLGNYLITLTSGTQSIHSLACEERLALSAGSLTLAAASQINNTLSI